MFLLSVGCLIDSAFRIPKFQASLAQLAEHALRKRMVMGSIPIGGLFLLPMVFAASLGSCALRDGGRGYTHFAWPVGLMDKASASGAGDSRFESWAGHFFLHCAIVVGHDHSRGSIGLA